MKLTRTALGAALLASSLTGIAYAGNDSNASEAAQSHRSNPVSKEQQQQYQSPSDSSGTNSSGTSSGTPDSGATPSGTSNSGSMDSSSSGSSAIPGDAPTSPSNTRDRSVLDTNHDGVITPDEQKQVHPGQPGGLPSSDGSSTR